MWRGRETEKEEEGGRRTWEEADKYRKRWREILRT